MQGCCCRQACCHNDRPCLCVSTFDFKLEWHAFKSALYPCVGACVCLQHDQLYVLDRHSVINSILLRSQKCDGRVDHARLTHAWAQCKQVTHMHDCNDYKSLS